MRIPLASSKVIEKKQEAMGKSSWKKTLTTQTDAEKKKNCKEIKINVLTKIIH